MVVDTKVLKMRVYKCLDDRKFPYSFTIKNNKIIKKLKATEIVKIFFQEQCNCLCTYIALQLMKVGKTYRTSLTNSVVLVFLFDEMDKLLPLMTCIFKRLQFDASVAQWIRHRPPKPGIAGSSPVGGILFLIA